MASTVPFVSLEDRVQIATPEGVPVDLVVAGLGSRFLAAMLDTLLQLVLIVAPLILLGLTGVTSSGWAEAFVLVWVFVVILGYYPVFETIGVGRTIGKRAAGVRVVHRDGGPVGFLTSAVRNLIRIIDFLPLFYGVGIIAILVTPRSQRLGDLAAGTYVVRERHAWATPAPLLTAARSGAALDAAAPADAPPEPWRDWDVSAITTAETALARRFLERRWTIDPHARAHFAAELGGRLGPKVPAAPPWPDETLLECIVAAKSARG